MCAPKPAPAPWAFTDTSALIGPPVRAAFSASAARSSGSNAPALEPAGNALPSFHSTASTGISQIAAARRFSSSTTFSAACVAAMPVAKVTREPAGQEGEADRGGVGDDRADRVGRDAEHLGHHHADGGARAADIRAAGRGGDRAVFVDMHLARSIRHRC